MPYVSRAQQAFFHANPRMHKYADEWDAATKAEGGFKKLPEHVKKKKKRKHKRHSLKDAIG